jgi:hypothetical protein
VPPQDTHSAESIEAKAIATAKFGDAGLLAADAVVVTPVLSTATQRNDYVNKKGPKFFLPTKYGSILEENNWL